MSEQTIPIPATEGTHPQVVIDSTPTDENRQVSEDQVAEALREIQENSGQISELVTEEENLVTEFFNSLLQILKSFSKTLEISVSSLPERYRGRTNKAYLYLTGQLVLVFANGEVEILNLTEEDNRQVLVDITGEIMAKLKTVISSYKSKTEKRVKFLMQITKELQRVAEVFTENACKK